VIRASASIVIGVIVFTHQPEAVASATFFGYSSDKTNAWLDYSFTVFKGSVSAGDVRFQQSGCVDVSATINGVAYHDGSLIHQIEVEQLTADVASPLYIDGYVDETHLEFYVEDVGFIGWSTLRSDVTSAGDFSYNPYLVSMTQGSGPVWLRVGDVIQYSLTISDFIFPNTDEYQLAGNIRLEEGMPVIDACMSVSWEESISHFLFQVGGEYQLLVGIDLCVSVPEPASLGLLTLILPLLANIRSRH